MLSSRNGSVLRVLVLSTLVQGACVVGDEDDGAGGNRLVTPGEEERGLRWANVRGTCDFGNVRFDRAGISTHRGSMAVIATGEGARDVLCRVTGTLHIAAGVRLRSLNQTAQFWRAGVGGTFRYRASFGGQGLGESSGVPNPGGPDVLVAERVSDVSSLGTCNGVARSVPFVITLRATSGNTLPVGLDSVDWSLDVAGCP